MNEPVQIPATIERCESRVNSALKLVILSQEGRTDEQIARFSTVVGKLGWLVFAPERAVDVSDLSNLPELPEETKSPAQRLRSVIYIEWKQRGSQGDFEAYYRQKIDSFIDQVKLNLV